MFKIILTALRWLFLWVYYISLVCFAGASLGVVTHFTFAIFLRPGADFAYYAALGFTNGLKYGSVWAGGAGIVLCVIRARREYMSRHSLSEK